MIEHIRNDIESNLSVSKEPFWKQIKKIAFTSDKEKLDKPNSNDFDPPSKNIPN